MAGKHDSASDASRERYRCMQCFTTHYQNDVLFATGRSTSRCDIRQAAQRYSHCTEERFADWCGRGRTQILLDWRTLPAEARRWERGVISAVQDLDGYWTAQRACPCCHQPLAQTVPVVFGWEGESLCSAPALELLRLAEQTDPARWQLSRMDQQPLTYGYLSSEDRPLLAVPLGLDEAKGNYGESCRDRCCTSADGAVLRLHLSLAHDGELEDTEAYQSLDLLLKHCGHTGIALKLPLLVWLEGLEPLDAVPLFREKGGQLERRLTYSFEQIYYTADLVHDPAAAVQAVAWLAEQTAACIGRKERA